MEVLCPSKRKAGTMDGCDAQGSIPWRQALYPPHATQAVWKHRQHRLSSTAFFKNPTCSFMKRQKLQ